MDDRRRAEEDGRRGRMTLPLITAIREAEQSDIAGKIKAATCDHSKLPLEHRKALAEELWFEMYGLPYGTKPNRITFLELQNNV